jgi:hypothetical protein
MSADPIVWRHKPHFGYRTWQLGGDSFAIGRYFHCQILATDPYSVHCDRRPTHATSIASHVETSSAGQVADLAVTMATNTEDVSD